MQSWTREWGDTIQSLDSLVTVLLVVLGGTLSFLGLRGQSVKEEIRPTEGMPLRSSSLQVMLEEKLAGGSTIKWVDRDLTDVGDVLTQGRMALIGPSRIGKTREALELIRKVISRDYVNEQRIYEPNYQDMQFLAAGTLPDAIKRTIRPETPILLFVDDFPYHFQTEVDLERLSIVLRALESCKRFYIVMTCRSDQLTQAHNNWLMREKFFVRDLVGLSPDLMTEFINNVAEALLLEVSYNAKSHLVSQSMGVPEVPRQILMQLYAHGLKVINVDDVENSAPTTAVDLWSETRRELTAHKPEIEFVLDALAVFHSANVLPLTPMVLVYANHIWSNTNRQIGWKQKTKLEKALDVLRVYEIRDQNGLLVFPDQIVAHGPSLLDARADLHLFFIRYRRLFRYGPFRHWYKKRRAHMILLYSLAGVYYGSMEYQDTIDLCLAANRLEQDFRTYHLMANTKLLLGDYSGAIQDYDKALELAPDSPSTLLARAQAQIDAGLLLEAQADLNRLSSQSMVSASTLKELGRLFRKQGMFKQALTYMDSAVLLEPDNYHTLAVRGHTLLLLERYEDAKRDLSQAVAINPSCHWCYYFRFLANKSLGDIISAQSDVSEAISLATYEFENKDAKTMLNLALYLLVDEQYEQAQTLYEQAMELGYSSEVMNLALHDLIEYEQFFPGHRPISTLRSMIEAYINYAI